MKKINKSLLIISTTVLPVVVSSCSYYSPLGKEDDVNFFENLKTRINLTDSFFSKYRINLLNYVHEQHQDDENLNFIFQKIITYEPFEWSSKLTSLSFKDFLKTKLGTVLIINYLSNQNLVQRFEKIKKEFNFTYDKNKPNFLNNDVLQIFENNEVNKFWLTFMYSQLNNFYYSIIKGDNEYNFEASFSTNGKEDVSLFDYHMDLKLKKINDNDTKNTEQKPKKTNSLNWIKKSIKETSDEIEKNGDKTIAVIPYSYLNIINNIFASKNTFFIRNTKKETTFVDLRVPKPDVSPKDAAIQNYYPYYFSALSSFDYVFYLTTLFFSIRENSNNEFYSDNNSKFLENYSRNQDYIDFASNVLNNNFKDLYFNNVKTIDKKYNWYVVKPKHKEVIFIVASEDNIEQFIEKTYGKDFLGLYNKYINGPTKEPTREDFEKMKKIEEYR